MTLSRSTILFFDASCLVLAANTPHGGSAYLIAVCGHRYLRGITSPDAIAKAERNSLEKFSLAARDRLWQLLEANTIGIVVAPSPAEIETYADIFLEDAHIVVEVLAKTDILVSVDRPLIRRVAARNVSMIAYSPKQFLEETFPDHLDHDAIRVDLT